MLRLPVLAAGPVLQRDHAGLDVHAAAAAAMYPSLSARAAPATCLQERVVRGDLGMKSGEGFFDWTEAGKTAVRQRYDRLLMAGLTLLKNEMAQMPRAGSPADVEATAVATA